MLSLVAVLFLWIDIKNPLIQACFLVLLSFAGVGLWDDLLKLKRGSNSGLSGKVRLGLELLISFGVLFWLSKTGQISTELYLPFFKDFKMDLGVFYLVFGAFVIAGSANAVNLTDGLDGLAIFPIMISVSTLGVLAYLSGNEAFSSYLHIPFVEGAGEITALSSGIVACCLAFLWYNSYPAQVFMGDVGALSLGGLIGLGSVLTKNEFLLLVFGGVFVVEALSVILQVISFKLTRKRIFKMSPLHHHFELKGVSESKIITRFWIVSILLAILSLAILKLR